MDDFRSLVVKRRDACLKFKDDKPSQDRREALRYYRGDNLDEYGDSGDGLSTVVSRDTMEAVESMMPSLVRPFVAGEEVVSFEPVGPEDEEGARQATDYVNHVFTTHNNAFRVVHDAMKDGLLYRLGVAKTVMEECEEGSPETYADLTLDELIALQAQTFEQGREIAGDIQVDGDRFEVTLLPKRVKKYRVHVIAPDEFLHEERLASLDQATFLGHSKRITLSDLIDMGIDEKKAKALHSGRPDSEEADQRHEQEDEEDWDDDDLARPVWVDECYIKCDPERKGVLEWRKVLLGGAQSSILSNEPADGHPYSAWTPIPVPHRLVGMSIHDITRDIQAIKTAVQRESLNALYLANRPMRAVVEGAANIDDLLNPGVGGLVRIKSGVRASDAVQAIPSGGEVAFGASSQMIEYYDGVRESRTGVTRYNQGMDANSLNIIASASQQRQELVARQFAEFLKDVFRKLLGLVSQHGTAGEYIRLRGKFVQVDPTDWKTNYDMTVSVGLGTSNKDQLVGQLQALLGIQQQIIQLQGGAQGPLVTMDNAFETLKRLQEAMGLKGDKYFTDPAEQQMLPAPEEPAGPRDDSAELEMNKEQIRAASAENVAHIRGQYDLAKQQPQIVPVPVDPMAGVM